MDIRLLEAFRAVIETGSVTHAALTLGVTQPAVSAQIARLEGELGFSLFERGGNRLRPTAEAAAFRDEVDRTLGSFDDLARAAVLLRDGEAGSLTVAAHPMAGITLLPPVVSAFLQKRPHAHVQLITRNSDVVRAMFPSRLHDIGISELPVDPTGLSVKRYRMECVAIMPSDHALAAHDVITPERLAGLPFVGMWREWSVHHLVTAAFAEAGVTVNVVANSEMFATICALVAGGAGVSIVDPASARQFAGAGLAVRPFRPVIPYEIAVFHAAERAPSRLAAAFLDAFDAHLQGLVQPAGKPGP